MPFAEPTPLPLAVQCAVAEQVLVRWPAVVDARRSERWRRIAGIPAGCGSRPSSVCYASRMSQVLRPEEESCLLLSCSREFEPEHQIEPVPTKES